MGAQSKCGVQCNSVWAVQKHSVFLSGWETLCKVHCYVELRRMLYFCRGKNTNGGSWALIHSASFLPSGSPACNPSNLPLAASACNPSTNLPLLAPLSAQWWKADCSAMSFVSLFWHIRNAIKFSVINIHTHIKGRVSQKKFFFLIWPVGHEKVWE